MESILGDTSAWHEHLSGAASIIKPTLRRTADGRARSLLQSTVEGRWLLRNFAYHDILASVSLDTDLLIPGRYWMDEDTVLDTYFGLASLPVAMIAEVTALRTQLRSTQQEGKLAEDIDPWSDFDAKVGQIEAQLLDWEPVGAHDHAIICLAQSYRSAALIYLYRTLRYYRRRPESMLIEDMSTQVECAIQFAEALPVAALPECTLLFPLFLAGAETIIPRNIQNVRSRLSEMLAYRRFDNVRIALDVLEELWDVKSRTNPVDWSRPYDWLDVLQRRGWKLALS
ncbi:hypothetical protein H2200_010848 [Cladophialophora chaetospira]|uniref:C6 transcription factor n=1 Tax=Cladophialophora chaetospira TaxID=386627 RepID=A0AA38X0W2_9EURO|nr:hypothetical protein H2200_010848 [Cladophialophora chaetospira]